MSRPPVRPASLTRRPFLGTAAVSAGLLTKDQLRSTPGSGSSAMSTWTLG